MSNDLSALGNFGGTARLFPLPNLVLFPVVVQPLHIFEPRYRQMTADALAGDRLLALALLRPGWEEHYEGRPPLHPVACLGRIDGEQRLEDGRFNLLLRGLARVRLLEELSTPKKLYRSARVEVLADLPVPKAKAASALRKELARRVPTWFAAQGPVVEQFRKLVRSDLPLGTLCDIFTFALPLDVEFKQQMLAETSVERRVNELLSHLEGTTPPELAAPSDKKFPPDFSKN